LNRAIQKQKGSKIFECFCFLLFVSMLIRVYSFIGNTEASALNLPMLVAVEFFAIVFGFIKAVSLHKLSFNSFEISAIAFWFWSCFSTISNEADIKDLVKDLVFQSFWLVVFLFFSVYLKDKKKTKEINFVFKLAYVFMIIIGSYYIIWSLTRPAVVMSGTVNTVYYPLMLLPLVFTNRKKASVVLGVVLVLFATLISEKRTALIALVLALAIPIMVNPVSKRKSKIIRVIFFLIIGLAVALLAYLFVMYFEIDIVGRFLNLSNDGGSGRNHIYATVWKSIKSLDIGSLFIGNGFNGVAKDKIVMLIDSNIFGFEYTSAHNDFLEIIYDYGVIGLILYVVFLIQMIKTLFKLYINRSRYFSMALSATILYLVVSTSSHLIIYPTYIVFLLMFMSVASNRFGKGEKD